MRMKRVVGIMGLYLKRVPKSIRREMLRDMIKLKLLKEEKRNFISIINKDRSLGMEDRFPEEKQKQNEGGWWE